MLGGTVTSNNTVFQLRHNSKEHHHFIWCNWGAGKEAMKKTWTCTFAAAVSSGAERAEYAKIPNRQLEYALFMQSVMLSSP